MVVVPFPVMATARRGWEERAVAACLPQDFGAKSGSVTVSAQIRGLPAARHARDAGGWAPELSPGLAICGNADVPGLEGVSAGGRRSARARRSAWGRSA